MAKHTITLSQKAETYLGELLYSLTSKNDRPANMSECISEAMESLADFEKLTEDQLVNWLNTNYPDRPKDKKGTWHENF